MMRQAEEADIKKSRFLKIAIHDLRQPIQALSLLHDALTFSSTDAGSVKLAERLGRVVTAASNGVNRLSEIAQLDAERMDTWHHRASRPEDEAQDGSAAERSILLVEDNPSVAAAVEMVLAAEGYQVSVAADGWQALELSQHGTKWPDLVIADYNLPDGLNGLDVIVSLQDRLDHDVAAIILTGGVSISASRAIENRGCVCLSKPVKGAELLDAVRLALAGPRANAAPVTLAANGQDSPALFVVDDDPAILEAMRDLLEANGCVVETFTSGAAFFAARRPDRNGCVLVDAFMPGMDGFELIERLRAENNALPAIMVTGAGDVPIAVRAMKAGAVDFIEKPVSARELLDCLHNALEPAPQQSRRHRGEGSWGDCSLTERQRQLSI
jgi:two-component system CheB/CheR fusion protein